MKIVAFEDVHPARWNAACDRSDDAWLFHRREWVEVEARHAALANRSFAVLADDGQIAAVLPLYVREHALGRWTERVVDCGVHRHTGLALVRGLPAADVGAVRRAAMSHVRQVATAEGADRIQLNAQNLAPRNLSAYREDLPFWVLEDGYQLGLHFGPQGFQPVPGMATCCADQIVPLAGRTEDELFEALAEACRRAVRKAVRSRVYAVAGDGADAIERYHDLALRSAKRTGERLPSCEYYRAIHDAFASQGRCQVLFAHHQENPVAGLLLLVDKGAVHFAAGASDPDFLSLRVNDFLHWTAIRWARERGHQYYRLGPIFPELPADWPLARVSRFKKKFGGRSVPIIQGSFYLHPEKYVGVATSEAEALCRVTASLPRRAARPPRDSEGLAHVIRCYGVPAVTGAPAVLLDSLGEAPTVVVVTAPEVVQPVGLATRAEPGGGYCYAAGRRRRLFGQPRPVYRALLPHLSFTGEGLDPVWVNADGRAVVAWHDGATGRRLLVGLDVEEEIIRYRQGDPDRVKTVSTKSRYGFGHERVNYLYDDQVIPGHSTVPWADHLGFLVAEAWARLTGGPLIEPLPRGAKAAVALTGDDDQADLEKYAEQRRLVGELPFTYFLHPLTKHTAETLRGLGPTIELGLHPDALDDPEAYEARCDEQVAWMEGLVGRKVRLVRNHNYLSRGYLGHLAAWEDSGLDLDVNCSAIDGTALTGSFLPMPVRRADGTWSEHRALLTPFGDGMIIALGMSDRRAARRVRQLARQTERTVPGVLVLNLHPQNLPRTRLLHTQAIALARRSGWIAIGLETLLTWLEARDTITVERAGSTAIVSSKQPVDDIVLRIPTARGWRRHDLGAWSGRAEVSLGWTR